MTSRPNELTALLIAPNRELADQFIRSLSRSKAFQIIGDLKSLPNAQTLEMRVRQLRPDVILLDVSSNLDEGCELIKTIASGNPAPPVICLHTSNDSEAIVRTLRTGASEFLAAPFDISIQEAAVNRLQKLIQPDDQALREIGKVTVFSSTKPGSGASTLATQLAFALSRKPGSRVLLVDLDLMGGTLAMNLNADYGYTVLDLLQHADRLDANLWSQTAVSIESIDVVVAPDIPYSDPVEQMRLHDFMQFARRMYDWVVIDVPAIFHRISLMASSEADRVYLVSTPELASLHLARKAVKMLNQLGFESSRFQVLLNRVDRKNELNGSDLGKLLDCPIDASLPNDFFSVQQNLTDGAPLGGNCELGRAIEGLANKLRGAAPVQKKGMRGLLSAKPVLSHL